MGGGPPAGPGGPGGPPRRRLPGQGGGPQGPGAPPPSMAASVPPSPSLTQAPDASMNPANIEAYLGQQSQDMGVDRFLQMLMGGTRR